MARPCGRVSRSSRELPARHNGCELAQPTHKGRLSVGPGAHFRRDGSPTKQTLVQYSVALDPRYAVCRAFRNHYWPAVYTTIPAAAFLSFDSMICASIAE
jgi:hypothetical protein